MEYALESSANVQDDVLQRELSHTSDEKMKSIIEQAGTVQILSKNGTDLRGEMQGRRVRHAGRKAIEKGQSNMMC